MSLCAQGMSSTRDPKQDLRPSQCETNRKCNRGLSHTHTAIFQSHTHTAIYSQQRASVVPVIHITVIIRTQHPNTHHTRRRVNSHGAHAHNVEVMITIHASSHTHEDNHTRSHEMITAHVTLSPPHDTYTKQQSKRITVNIRTMT